jgi:hypothetical protein
MGISKRIRVIHLIKVKRIKPWGGSLIPGRSKPIKLAHKIKLKPLKLLREMFAFGPKIW